MRKFDLVPMKHERWCTMESISEGKESHPSHETICSFVDSGPVGQSDVPHEALTMRKFQAHKNHFQLGRCVCLCDGKGTEKNIYNKTDPHDVLEDQQGKAGQGSRESCEMELNNRKVFWLITHEYT